MSEFPSFEDYLNNKNTKEVDESLTSIENEGVITFEDYINTKKPDSVFKVNIESIEQSIETEETIITFEDYLNIKNQDELQKTLYELEHGSDSDISFEEFKELKEKEKSNRFEGFNLLKDDNETSDIFGDHLGLITFEDYKRIKENSISIGDQGLEIYQDTFITEDDEKLFSQIQGLISFEEYLDIKKTGNPEKVEELKTKGLSEHIIDAIKTKKFVTYVDIQSQQYLDESRKLYNEEYQKERKRLHSIYPQVGDFFGVGAPVKQEKKPNEDCAVIGTAIIGKNVICG